jgi:hypothetical protein
VREAMNLSIPHIKSKNSTFRCWSSNSLKYYITKKNQHFIKYKKSKSDHNCDVSSCYRKLVKITIKTDRLRWLKSVCDNLKTKPKNFWKYVSKFKKNDHVVTHLQIGENIITQPQCIVEASANHISSIFNSPSKQGSFNFL